MQCRPSLPEWEMRSGIFWKDEVPLYVPDRWWFPKWPDIHAFIWLEILEPIFSFRTHIICGTAVSPPVILSHVRHCSPNWPALKEDRWSESLSILIPQVEEQLPDDILEMDEMFYRRWREYYHG